MSATKSEVDTRSTDFELHREQTVRPKGIIMSFQQQVAKSSDRSAESSVLARKGRNRIHYKVQITTEN